MARLESYIILILILSLIVSGCENKPYVVVKEKVLKNTYSAITVEQINNTPCPPEKYEYKGMTKIGETEIERTLLEINWSESPSVLIYTINVTKTIEYLGKDINNIGVNSAGIVGEINERGFRKILNSSEVKKVYLNHQVCGF